MFKNSSTALERALILSCYTWSDNCHGENWESNWLIWAPNRFLCKIGMIKICCLSFYIYYNLLDSCINRSRVNVFRSGESTWFFFTFSPGILKHKICADISKFIFFHHLLSFPASDSIVYKITCIIFLSYGSYM